MTTHSRWCDDPAGYGELSILLHWLVAILVLALAATGLLMRWSIGLDDQSLYLWIKHMHISLGVLLGVALVPRTAWRLASGMPASPRQGLGLWLARLGPASLLFVVVLQAATGVTARWSDVRWVLGADAQWRVAPGAESLPFFGLFELPSPLSDPSREWNALLERLHDTGAWLVLALLALHITAGLFHFFTGKTSAHRMLRPSRRGDSAAPSP